MSPVPIRKRWSRRASSSTKTWLTAVGIRAAIVLAIMTGIYLGVRRMHSDLRQVPRYQVSLSNLKLQVPSWVTPTVLFQLKQVPNFPERFSILEPDVANKLARAYARNPWVKRVRTVEKRYPQALRISLEVRQPVAAMRFKDKYYLTDAEGVRLPITYDSWPQRDFKLPFVTDAFSGPPAPGQVWEDAGVRAGLAVATVLRQAKSPIRQRITAIDVKNLGGQRSRNQSDIVLLTENRIPIYWGRSPLGQYTKELAVTQKLENLALAFRRTDGLKQSNIQYVDIRFPNIYICRGSAQSGRASSALASRP